MFKHILFLLLLAASTLLQAQTINGSFVHGGITRTYSYYVPASYTVGQAAPLVLNLHGYTSSGTAQALYTNFMPIADTAGFIIVHPNGTNDPFTQQPFWNFGIAGATVDDFSFLQALLDTIASNYTINLNRVYCTGMSNGGFMSFAMACETDRFAAIASVTGSMSIPMYNACNPANPIPAMAIHGTTDATVAYTGSSTSKSIPDVVAFWVTENNCNLTPTITQIPNTNTADNCTAEHHLYSGGTNGNTVEHYKIIDGGHTWPGGTINTGSGNTNRDFNASKEIWRFFSQYPKGVANSIDDVSGNGISLYPNPATNVVYVKADNNVVNHVTVTDMQGRVVLQQNADNIQHINVSQLQAGSYIVKMHSNTASTVRRIVVQ